MGDDSPFTNLAHSRAPPPPYENPQQNEAPRSSGIKPRRPPPPLPTIDAAAPIPPLPGNPFATPPQPSPHPTTVEQVAGGMEFLGLAEEAPPARAPPPPPPSFGKIGRSRRISGDSLDHLPPPGAAPADDISRETNSEGALIDVDNSPFQPSLPASDPYLVADNVNNQQLQGAGQDDNGDDDDDIFGLKQLAASRSIRGTESNSSTSSAPGAARRMFSRSSNISVERSLSSSTSETPVAVEVRLPPLNPKVSARLRALAAGNGSLFGAPSASGGVLQWARAEGELGLPPEIQSARFSARHLTRAETGLIHTSPIPSGPAAVEDQDAAPSHDAGALPRKTATQLMVDDARGVLWVGYSDGHVCGYDIGGDSGAALSSTRRLYYWQAHRIGHITAMCLGPTGELWTGSSRGTVRVWQPGSPLVEDVDVPQPPVRCRELRRGGGDRAHNGAVVYMIRSSDGQIVWTASAKGVNLWESSSGAFLGPLKQLHRRSLSAGTITFSPLESSITNPAPGPGSNEGIDVSNTTSSNPTNPNPSAVGLPVDPVTGALLATPSPASRAKIWAQQEVWANQSDKGMAEFAERLSAGGQTVVQGAGKAVKFMSKLGQKLAQNIQGGGKEKEKDRSVSGSTRSSGAANTSGDYYSQSGMIQQQVQQGGYQAGGVSVDDPPSAGTEAPIPGVPNAGTIQSIVATLDNKVWVVYKRGRIEQYSSAGQLLGVKDLGNKIQVAAAVGRRVWVAFTNGWLSILGPDGSGLKSFYAHQLGVIALAQAGSRVYTLAADGSLTGWSAALPGSSDDHALDAWHKVAPDTFDRRAVKMLCVTWNCGESRPYPGSEFFRHIKEQALEKSLIVIGLQEVEMGSTSVALAAAKDAISYKIQERGNSNAKFWSCSVLTALGGERHWHQLGLRQLSGMLIMVFGRNTLKGHLGEVATASVACGVLGVGGNKGAVAVEFTLYRRKFTVVCSHFAAHQGAVEARNGNYVTISKQLTFTKRAWFGSDDEEVHLEKQHLQQQQLIERMSGVESGIGGGSAVSTPGAGQANLLGDFGDDFYDDYDEGLHTDMTSNITLDDTTSIGTADSLSTILTDTTNPSLTDLPSDTDLIQGEGLRAANVLVWLGDFNYRIDLPYGHVKELIAAGRLDMLVPSDQCRKEMVGGRVFRGMREGPLGFAPTYKFDKGAVDVLAYDSSEKRRVPAWCDRVMYRGSMPFPPIEDVGDFSDEGAAVPAGSAEEESSVTVTCKEYSSWSDVYDSDHKPVYSILDVSLPVTDYDHKRDACSTILQTHFPALSILVPELSLSPNTIKLHSGSIPQDALTLVNNGAVPALFQVVPICVTLEAAACVALWPDQGIVLPGEEVKLHVKSMLDEEGSFVPGPREVRYQVVAGPEYRAGGEESAVNKVELEFKVMVLPQFSPIKERRG